MHDAEIRHHIPGRMRLAIKGAKEDPPRLDEIKQALSEIPGVRAVTATAGAAGFVVQYDPGLDPGFRDTVAERCRAAGLFELGALADEEQTVTHRALDETFDSVNRSLRHATRNVATLKEAFPFAVAAYAVAFVDKAVAASQWLNWIQFAFSSYLDLHQNAPAHKMSRQVEALHREVAAMHETLRQLAAKP
jgi:hypothetical protein